MKRTLIATAVTAALFTAPAFAAGDAYGTDQAGAAFTQLAQAGTPPTGPGMGPGMMGPGQGMGPGMMGQGYGPGYGPMGPGMMGQGYGPGMMGQGYGPGMMGQGYGPGMMGQGYGPGMMGQGMGPGMMGGMMGSGMMYGANPYAALDLSAEQRAKIGDIQEGLWRKQWDLMGKMHEERYHMHQLMSGVAPDDASARKAYQAMADAHKKMFDAMLDARKQIDAVLTKEQRDRLKRGS
jgi:protein CpxP